MKTTQNTKIFVPLFFVGMIMTTMFFGCTRDKEERIPFTVNAVAPTNLPEGAPDLDMTTMVARMTNQQGRTFEGNLNSEGSVILNVEPGIYNVTVIGQLTMPGEEIATIQGVVGTFTVTRDGVLTASVSGENQDAFDMNSEKTFFLNEVTIQLSFSYASELIIRQVYFGGGPTTEGANWNRDQFIEVFNNSDRIVYLDSLIIGGLAPTNGWNANPNHNTWTEVGLVAFFGSMWMVPGSGTCHPLLPGEGVVFAPEAVDHGAHPRNALSGLQLNRAHFAMFNAQHHTAQTEPAEGVIILEMLTAPAGNRFVISVTSPAVAIARIPNMQAEWWDRMDEFHITQPGSTSQTRHWTIRPEWIIDGVDITTPDAAQGATSVIKRLPTNIDLTFTYLENGNTVGDAITRRLDRIENGRHIYQVTRNSAADFVTARPNPRLRP